VQFDLDFVSVFQRLSQSLSIPTELLMSMTADEYVVIDSELQTCQCMDDSDTLDRPWSLPSLASRVVAVDKGEDGRKDDELSQSGCISGGCHHD